MNEHSGGLGRNARQKYYYYYSSKSKVMSCSGYVNTTRMHHMHVRLCGEVECFKYQRSQVPADGGCKMDVGHRMSEGYKA